MICGQAGKAKIECERREDNGWQISAHGIFDLFVLAFESITRIVGHQLAPDDSFRVWPVSLVGAVVSFQRGPMPHGVPLLVAEFASCLGVRFAFSNQHRQCGK